MSLDLSLLASLKGHTIISKEDAQGLYCQGCRYYFRTLYSIETDRWRCPNCLTEELT